MINVKMIAFQPGDIVIVGRKVYSNCSKCGRFIQLNKFILGDLHFCKNGGDEIYSNLKYATIASGP